MAEGGLAEAESLASDATNDVKGQDRAMADAERAIALAPDLADAYGARGRLRHVNSWNWVGAQVDFEKALALNPGDSGIQTHYAELLATVGRQPAAVAAARKAVRSTRCRSGRHDGWGSFSTTTVKSRRHARRSA